MRLVEVERFVGLPYSADDFDCADLVMLVQRELFGREVVVPGRRPRGAQGAAELGELSKPFAKPREGPPSDGDLVLMIEVLQKRPRPAGGFFFFSPEGGGGPPHQKKNGCAVLHRVRDLPDFGLRIEGFYEWLN